ncbi:MAG TPA: F0F1 ATP synthase subunit B [Acidimicrobiales bacterium]|jgi:F-type H+-transporting ATPase subunit b|nr:F0F1 ATP synthase subunit B [Acidimicrobiales bacterium]
MRMRMLLAAVLLAAGAVLFVPSVASAQEQPTESTASTGHLPEANVECIEILENSNSKIDDCQKAPSPILPAKNELIWGTISFVVLFVLLWKFAWPGLKKALETRTERIRDDLNAADGAKTEAEHVLEEYRAQLSDARNESARIIEEARQQADALRRDQEQRLQTELAAMRERASADVEAAKTQAIADLRREVSSLAIGAAEVVVQRNLDRPTQEQLIENYINQVASRN